MADDGSLPKSTIIAVLKAHGVSVYPQAEDHAYTVITDGKETTLALRLGDAVSRKAVHGLQRKFGIPIHHFYNPQLAPEHPALGPVSQKLKK